MTQPHAVQSVLRALAAGPGELIRTPDRAAQRLGDPIQGRLIHETRKRIRTFHRYLDSGVPKCRAVLPRLSRPVLLWYFDVNCFTLCLMCRIAALVVTVFTMIGGRGALAQTPAL